MDVPLLIPLFLKSLIKIAVAISPTSYSYLFPPSIYFGTLFVSFHLLYNIELQINFTIATILLSNTHCSNIHNIIAVISTTSNLFFSCTCRWQQTQASGAVCMYKEHYCANSVRCRSVHFWHEEETLVLLLIGNESVRDTQGHTDAWLGSVSLLKFRIRWEQRIASLPESFCSPLIIESGGSLMLSLWAQNGN